MSEISTIYPPSSTGSSVLPSISASKITSELSHNNMTVLDASVLSPMIRRVLQEQQDQFMNRLEQSMSILANMEKKVKRVIKTECCDLNCRIFVNMETFKMEF